jgi:hypothetical protein
MRKTRLITAILTVVCFATCMTADARSQKVKTETTRKGDQQLGTPVELDVGISFSANSGQTITDSDGTTFVYYGLRCWEDKIYPPEYWGVFPLYFFGRRVGINVSIRNESETQDANLRVTTECYCLRTDGGNGAQLLPLQSREVTVAASETTNIDASFVGEFVEGAESGLDRFLVKIYESASINYVVVKDAPNTVKYEDATIGLGEDGASQKDYYTISLSAQASGSGGTPPPVPSLTTAEFTVQTKAGNSRATTVLSGSGSSAVDDLGFTITIESISALNITMSVEATGDNAHALSHVEFAFAEDMRVVSPSEGTAAIYRETLGGSASTLIQTKEGVFCPPEPDEELSEAIDTVVNP